MTLRDGPAVSYAKGRPKGPRPKPCYSRTFRRFCTPKPPTRMVVLSCGKISYQCWRAAFCCRRKFVDLGFGSVEESSAANLPPQQPSSHPRHLAEPLYASNPGGTQRWSVMPTYCWAPTALFLELSRWPFGVWLYVLLKSLDEVIKPRLWCPGSWSTIITLDAYNTRMDSGLERRHQQTHHPFSIELFLPSFLSRRFRISHALTQFFSLFFDWSYIHTCTL